ncbi:S1C family serine protease [Schaalia sp. ZJ405]|uniref:S1C family serine protease n=1 Tax=Schaalia sp. ZJ405 TaxID=2709403 RepID=UPI001E2BF69A|nr:trypsin-like peptidase domain-containing protein [Schaalia sp. ZJ405]
MSDETFDPREGRDVQDAPEAEPQTTPGNMESQGSAWSPQSDAGMPPVTETPGASGEPQFGGAAASSSSNAPSEFPPPVASTRIQGYPGPHAGEEMSHPTPDEQPTRPSNPFAAPTGRQTPTSMTAPQPPIAPQTPQAPQPMMTTNTSRGRARSKGPGWGALIVAMVVTALVTAGGFWGIGGALGLFSHAESSGSTAHSSSSTSSTTQTVPKVPTSGESANWQAVAKAVSPAVVTISVVGQNASGVGSGVIYDAKGDIVTNYHVISKAIGSKGGLSVTLADGRIYDAEIVGYDQTTDLAVIKLVNAPSDLTVASFGSSKDLAVGQQVMAIGAPLGLSNTVTTGIVSALNRPVEVSAREEREPQEPNPLDPFNQLPNLRGQQQAGSESVITNAIQVDASINPGNSGGPLFNANGAVIGINSSIASMSSTSSEAGSIGLGFAIPADLVTSVADQLIANGTADHAVLGVSITTGEVDVDGATKAGAKVAQVSPGGAAAAAGIREGDVIVAVNGSEVSSAKQLTGYIRRYKGGDEVSVSVVRDGKVEDIKTTLQSQSR